jgi:hypothetical protein
LACDADFGCLILLEQRAREAIEAGHVFGAVIFASAAVVFAEGDVENPRLRVLNAPEK